jgi:hypothetical protein
MEFIQLALTIPATFTIEQMIYFSVLFVSSAGVIEKCRLLLRKKVVFGD